MIRGFSKNFLFNKLNEAEVLKTIDEELVKNREKYIVEKMTYKSKPLDEPIKESFFSEVKNLPENDNPEAILKDMDSIVKKYIKDYDKIINIILNLFVTEVNKVFISFNRDLEQSYAYTTAYAVAVAKDEKSVKTEFSAISGLAGSEIIESLDNKCKVSCEKAIELLGAEKIIPGDYDIICDPDFTGLIAHEAFGHGAEMDMFVKDRAKGKEYMGKRVGSDILNMRDGAKSYTEVSSYLFDDEGNLGSDTHIIVNGFLENGMADEISSLNLGVKPTGNGKRESYKRKAYTRMTNTFFDEGDSSLEEMMADMDYGFLIEGFTSGMEDPKNWGIQCVASKAREIKDGKLTGKIFSPVYLTGYVPDLLTSISKISKGLKLSGSGYCGKGWKEWVKTSTGGSYIKAKGRLS